MVKKKPSSLVSVHFDDHRIVRSLFGPEDTYLRSLEKALDVEVSARGGDVRIAGDPLSTSIAEQTLAQLYRLLKKGHPIIRSDIEDAVRMISRDRSANLEVLFADTIVVPTKKRPIIPRSPAQKLYLQAIRDHDIVLSIGPAGTGKTYLACAMALSMLLKQQFKRIILARPAVEAGEKLGFLPGDLVEKVNPYLRPLYDALYDMLEIEKVREMMDEGLIEIAPIAFMRGRTLHNAFIIIDEAQNATYHQMKMCLTRLGTDSKMVVTGDITQIDLPETTRSGMLEAWRILKGMPGMTFHEFTETDIVRHPLVSNIVKAYEKDEKRVKQDRRL
jgi:phosphate starvation-inducible PhoH-like protein